MKYVILLFVGLITCSTCAQKTEAQLMLDKIIEIVTPPSLYRNDVDWTALKKDMHALAKDADSIPQLKPALDLMLKELNDDHGRVFHNNKFLSYYSGNKKEHLINLDSNVYTDIQYTVYPFKTELLNDNIGYVRIVCLPMGDNEKMTTEIQDAVCKQINNGAQHWIIDLRYNGGGNMFPMVEGITSIIGDGFVGGTKGVTEEESSVWKIEAGDFYYDEFTVGLKNKCTSSKDLKIAVLTSAYTASSGEALAVILKHRNNTRFFGEKTNGKITATNYIQIDSLTAMSISVSYYKDRKGNIYKKYVDVDETIEFSPGIEIEKDTTISRAIKWIND